jgi:hypothetical protein
MSAFTAEQKKILQAAFDHIWSRMAALHDDLNEDSSHIVGLGFLLTKKGLITSEQWDAALNELGAAASVEMALHSEPPPTEEEVTGQILAGDTEAGVRHTQRI